MYSNLVSRRTNPGCPETEFKLSMQYQKPRQSKQYQPVRRRFFPGNISFYHINESISRWKRMLACERSTQHHPRNGQGIGLIMYVSNATSRPTQPDRARYSLIVPPHSAPANLYHSSAHCGCEQVVFDHNRRSRLSCIMEHCQVMACIQDVQIASTPDARRL